MNAGLGVYMVGAVAAELYKAAWVVAARMQPDGVATDKLLVKLLAARLGSKVAGLVVGASRAKARVDGALSGRGRTAGAAPPTPAVRAGAGRARPPAPWASSGPSG